MYTCKMISKENTYKYILFFIAVARGSIHWWHSYI